MKNNTIITIVVVIVVGAAAFFGGMKYQQSKAASTYAGGTSGAGFARQGGQRMGRNGAGAPVMGKIVSQDANTLTIQLMDGSSKIINVSDTTKITKTDTASKSALTTGETVAAFGTSNSDGSVTAQNIQLNPMFRMGGGQNRQPSQQ